MFDVDRNQSDIGLHMSLVPADPADLKRKERSIMSMGDVLPPRRQAVMDRLRRRIERYRLHHFGSCLPRYNSSLNGIIQQQQQDTIILRQRFLEAKAKKAGKKSEPKSKAGLGGDSSSAGGGATASSAGTGSTSATNSGAGGGNGSSGAGGGAASVTTNSNTTVSGPQPKYKRTVEDTSSSPLSGCSRSTSGQNNGGEGAVSGGNSNTNAKSNLTQFSVEIEFSSPGQQIQTNVKVTTVASNSIKTSGSPAPRAGNNVVNGNSASVTSSTTTTTTVIEPSEHGSDVSVRNVSKTGSVVSEAQDKPVDENRDTKSSFQLPEFKPEPIGAELFDACGDDINDETIEAFMKDFSSDDMDHVMNLEDIVVDPFRLDHGHLSGLGDHKMNIDSDSVNLGQLPPYPVVSQSSLPLFTGSSPTSDSMTLNLLTNMTNTAVRPPSYTNQSSLGLNFLGKESSPAAQTLKQMAEQHQQQQQQKQQLNNIGLNTSSPFTSEFNQFGGPGSGSSMEFLSSPGGNPNCYLPKNGAGSLFPFDSNSLTTSSGNKSSDGLYRSTQRFHLPTHLQDATKNPLNQARTSDSKNMCSGNGVASSGPSANMLTGHCSPEINSGAGPTGSPLSFVGTKPLSHFGDSNQSNNNGSNNGTRQYMRTPGNTAQPRSQASAGGASSPLNTVPPNLRQQRHHYIGMPNTQNGHHLQVSQGQHVTVGQDQQSTTMYSYGQASPQVTPSAPSDHFQLSINQSQGVTFNAGGANSIQSANSERMVSVNQTTVVQMSAGGPPLNMMNHHSQLLRPTTMHSQSDPTQQQQQMMQMQMDKRKLNQQQVRNHHAGLAQFGVRPPPPDYGSQMNLMSGGQQQPSLMAGVMTNQSGQMMVNNNSSIRSGNVSQPRLPSSMNVGNGNRMPMINNRNGQQMNLGSVGLTVGGVPVNSNRTNLGMPGRMTSFMGDDPRPPNVDIGPDGLNIGLRGNVGGVGQDWRQRITLNQHPGAKFQVTNAVSQMSGVNHRFAGQLMPDQRGLQQNNVDNMQMMTMQQQQHLNMLNRMSSGGVNNCPPHSGHHHQMQHQQMSIMQQQQGNSSSQQSVNAHLMTHMSSSVVSSTNATHFLPNDTAAGDFSDFFESGGFGANDLLNSFDLDIQNGNSGDNLL